MRCSIRFAGAFAAALCTGAFGSAAPANAIYRCGNQYANAPCTDGRLVAASDPVTPARRDDARKVALDEQRLADRMARERRADEAAIHPAGAASLGPSKPRIEAKVAGPRTKTKAKKRATTQDDEDFIAHVPKVKVAKS
jgi:hypothetical protein